MAAALQNRLIGTIILVALVVIFLPDILDGEKSVNRESFVEVPPIPNHKRLQSKEYLAEESVTKAASRDIEILNEPAIDDPYSNENLDSNKESGSQTEPTVSVDAENINTESVGWVVQLGSFRHEKNVKELLDKLENSGYRAFSRKVNTQSGVLTKVFVGPDVDKIKLESALPHLKEVTSLQGRITPFTVE